MNRMRNLAGAAVAAVSCVSASSTSLPNPSSSSPPPSPVCIIVSVLATGQSRVDWQPARELNCPRRGGTGTRSVEDGASLANRPKGGWPDATLAVGEVRAGRRGRQGGRWRWRAGVVYVDAMKLMASARRVTRIDQTLNITEERHTHTHLQTYTPTYTHTHKSISPHGSTTNAFAKWLPRLDADLAETQLDSARTKENIHFKIVGINYKISNSVT